MTSGGGRARGEMMIPGAVLGSEGRFDQMTQPPSFGSVLGMGDGGGEVGGAGVSSAAMGSIF